jgi:hypothetical protein
MVELLAKQCPQGLLLKDNSGSLPLHLAVATKAPLEMVKLLADEGPNALQTENGDGWLPLLATIVH